MPLEDRGIALSEHTCKPRNAEDCQPPPCAGEEALKKVFPSAPPEGTNLAVILILQF